MKKALSILITSLLLFLLSVNIIFALQLGNKYWIKGETNGYFFSDIGLSSPLKIAESQYADVIEYNSNIYKLYFQSGEIAYINADNFNGLRHYNIKFILTEAQKTAADIQDKLELKAIKDKAEKEKQENIAKAEAELKQWEDEKTNIYASLKAHGIYDNRIVWLKYPDFNLPGLTKINVKSIEIIKEERAYTYTSKIDTIKKVIFNIDSDYDVDKLEFDTDTERITDSFFTKYPANKWSKKVLKAIQKADILIAMTTAQVTASWGLPKQINRSGGKWGLHEQWVYGEHGTYLYFENGKLTSWQD